LKVITLSVSFIARGESFWSGPSLENGSAGRHYGAEACYDDDCRRPNAPCCILRDHTP